MRAARATVINRLLVAGAAGALIAAGLVTAGEANASPDTDYLNALNSVGIVIYDTQAALNTGYAICEAFETTTGDVVAENLYRITPFEDVPTRDVAAAWVVVAGATLCPWMYNPQQQAAFVDSGMGGAIG